MAGDQFNKPQFPNNLDRIRSIISHILELALDQYAELAAAISFLTLLPIPGPERLFRARSTQYATPTSHVGLGSGYFPLVGLLLALVLSLLVIALRSFMPQLALSALLVVVLVLLTGGLHLDGLMDTCDGLFGGSTPERRLEIMRDSRVGSFAVLGAVCALLLEVTFLASLQERLLIPALLIALPTSRWTMVLALRVFPAARSTGLGALFRQLVIPWRLVLAGVTALIIVLFVGLLVGLIVWVVTTLVSLALGAWITRRLGGNTGDTYGAIAEVAEVVALLLIVILQRWV